MKSRRSALWAMVLAGIGCIMLGFAAVAFLSNSDLVWKVKQDNISAVPVKVSFPAPTLSLTDLSGNPAALSDYAGKVVLVNNWATWCPPCRGEMPTLEAYYQDHKDHNFVLIGIEAGEPPSEISAFVEKYQLSFPIWVDEESRALNAFRNDSLPSSYLIDAEGIVRLTWTGPINLDMLEKHVTPFLED